jgi:hypothetical protein
MIPSWYLFSPSPGLVVFFYKKTHTGLPEDAGEKSG